MEQDYKTMLPARPIQQIEYPDVDYRGAVEYIGRFLPEERAAEIARLRAAGCPAVTIARLMGAKYELDRQMPPAAAVAPPRMVHAYIVQLPEGWDFKRVLIIVTVGGGFLTAGYLLIPFAVGAAIVIGQMIGYIIAAAFTFFLLGMFWLLFRGNSAASEPASPSGATYVQNVTVIQHQENK